MPSPQSPSKPKKATYLLVGTANRHKLEEIMAALSGYAFPGGEPLQVTGIDFLPPGKPVEESGSTFAENARIKAVSYARRALELPLGERPRWVLADDSGLSVDALDGAPGVLSARYAGPGATDGDNNRKLLQALQGVGQGRHGAKFVCVMACVELGEAEAALMRAGNAVMALPVFFAEGDCQGEILTAERGQGGFGYDPLFFLPELGKTMAQLSQGEKNRVSHRGRALRVLGEHLEKCLKDESLEPKKSTETIE